MRWSVMWVALLLWHGAQAAPGPDVRVELEVVAVQAPGPDGRERFGPAEKVSPGDLLEYRARYVNRGDATARDVEATLPIPAGGVVYVADSARPRSVLASTDGTLFEAMPLKRTVTLPDGRRQTELVPLAEYRYLRWKLGNLAAGGDVTVVSRVRLTSLDVAQSGVTPGLPAGANGRAPAR
ncbi:MAG: hypothetical protein REI09_08620 [Candidatus Dactylopiibacterium sp.]|nr:hypothetical protein [Candidatus Dactylopiibacterium sp.]